MLCGVLAPMMVWACYNDRDTLGYELHNKPDVQRALTGRFDRFPNLYYEMRVNRLRSKGALAPDEYDDLAVALGRLGRNDEALAVLAQKARLPGLTPNDLYRLYANRGTIKAHKWFHDGANPSNRQELDQAEADIAEALRLNPTAHFGREGTQLELLRWVADVKSPRPKGAPEKKTLSQWLVDHTDENVDLLTTLSGLIMLGGAWESPDAALAIAGVRLRASRRQTMTLALERYNELISLGKKPIDPDLSDDEAGIVKTLAGTPGTGEYSTPYRFKQLRKEADAWHEAKTQFMMARLTAGRHPDTDPGFWTGWEEPPMPVIPLHRGGPDDWTPYVQAGVLLVVFLGVPVAVLLCRDRLRRIGRLV